MRPQDHCDRLTRRLRAAGLDKSKVCYESEPFTKGYYIAPAGAASSYAAYGAGTPFVACCLTLAQAEAFVGGMFLAARGVAS